jgi:hypothetical protein
MEENRSDFPTSNSVMKATADAITVADNRMLALRLEIAVPSSAFRCVKLGSVGPSERFGDSF